MEFSYGSLDCAMFVCNAVKAMTGTDLAAGYRELYHNQETAERLLRKKNLLRIAIEVARKHDMHQFERPEACPRGSVVMLYSEGSIDYTLGLNDGRFALAPLISGLAYVRPGYIVKAWRV